MCVPPEVGLTRMTHIIDDGMLLLVLLCVNRIMRLGFLRAYFFYYKWDDFNFKNVTC